MLVGMVRGPGLLCLLFAVPACSSDTFVPGDAGDDAATEAAFDGSVDDAPGVPDVVETEGSTGDGGEPRFCQANTTGFFCDDFDDPSETDPWSKWSTETPSASNQYFNFVSGFAGQGAEAAASGTFSKAFLAKQIQGDVLHALFARLKLPAKVGGLTLVEVDAGGSSFVLGTDTLGGNLTAKGDSGGATSFAATDLNWHRFDVVFVSGQAQVSEDGALKVTVPFTVSSPTASTFSVGIVGSAAGGKVVIDNVLLQ